MLFLFCFSRRNAFSLLIGDVRVWFEVVTSHEVSFIAKQVTGRGEVGDRTSLRLISEGE